MALQTRRTGPQAFSDAIRSIAMEEIDGEDTGKRSQWLANRFRIPHDTVRIQVDEMIDLLTH